MIHLVVTANDSLYMRVTNRLPEDEKPLRATNALDGAKLAAHIPIDQITVDLALYAADTLVESLRTRPETAHIPVHAIKAGTTIPLELRRLCVRVWEAHDL